ncbi:hypothetical protein ACLOJK_010609 [Asimina triloba]
MAYYLTYESSHRRFGACGFTFARKDAIYLCGNWSARTAVEVASIGGKLKLENLIFISHVLAPVKDE